MSINIQTNLAVCPDCDEQIPLHQPYKMREKITCPNCWAYLEVTGLHPLKLSWDESEFEYEDMEAEDE